MNNILSLPVSIRLVVFAFNAVAMIFVAASMFMVYVSKRKKYVFLYLSSYFLILLLNTILHTPLIHLENADIFNHLSLLNLIPAVVGIYLYIKQRNIFVLIDVIYFLFNLSYLEYLIPIYGYILSGLTLVPLVRSLMMLFKARRENQDYPGTYAIKYTLDHLHVGVIYANNFHQITYINESMSSLLKRLGLSSYEKVNVLIKKMESFISREISKEEFIITFNNSYYRIIRDKDISQITCFDITKEETLLNEIKENQKILSSINNKLEEELKAIEKTQENKALLSMKGYIHDSLAQKLSVLHTFLINESSSNLKEIKKMLESIDLFFDEEENKDDLNYLINLLKEIGVTLVVHGELNEESEIKSLYLKAIKECTTNAIRHGNAHQIDVYIKDDEIIIENDGEIPKDIKYGNGLNNLSLIAEYFSYQLKTNSDDKFQIILYKTMD